MIPRYPGVSNDADTTVTMTMISTRLTDNSTVYSLTLGQDGNTVRLNLTTPDAMRAQAAAVAIYNAISSAALETVRTFATPVIIGG